MQGSSGRIEPGERPQTGHATRCPRRSAGSGRCWEAVAGVGPALVNAPCPGKLPLDTIRGASYGSPQARLLPPEREAEGAPRVPWRASAPGHQATRRSPMQKKFFSIGVIALLAAVAFAAVPAVSSAAVFGNCLTAGSTVAPCSAGKEIPTVPTSASKAVVGQKRTTEKIGL